MIAGRFITGLAVVPYIDGVRYWLGEVDIGAAGFGMLAGWVVGMIHGARVLWLWPTKKAEPAMQLTRDRIEGCGSSKVAIRWLQPFCINKHPCEEALFMMKNSWVICGPESSGSVFLARTISFAIGYCKSFGQYSGHGYNSKIHCENLVLHRSLPYMRPKRFQNSLLEEIAAFAKKYERVNYILTTRDKSCSILSKLRRFGGSIKEAEADYSIVFPFFESLVNDDNCFIWNYESMLLLGQPYFYRMYRHFGIDSDFVPEVHDGNLQYIVNEKSMNWVKQALTITSRSIWGPK
jgi:hypothetical protein